jgi:hypothetical protein
MILKTETYRGHTLELTRQGRFFVEIKDEDGLHLATTDGCHTPAFAFDEARKIIDNQVPGPALTPRGDHS